MLWLLVMVTPLSLKWPYLVSLGAHIIGLRVGIRNLQSYACYGFAFQTLDPLNRVVFNASFLVMLVFLGHSLDPRSIGEV